MFLSASTKKRIFRTRQVKKTTGPVVVRLAEMATKREREDTPVLVSLKKVSLQKNDEAPREFPEASAGLTVSVLIVRLTWEVCKVCLW